MCYFVVRAWWGVGQGQPGAIHITCSHCWDNWYEWGRYWYKPASTKITFKTYLQNEEKLGNWWAGSIFCDRFHWRFPKTEWVLLPDLPKGRILTPPWQFRCFTALPRNPTFHKGPTPAPWDYWMAFPLFWRQASDWRWAGEAAWQNFAGSLNCSGQSTRFEKTWFRMFPETLTLNFLCSPKFRSSSMCFNWVGATNCLNVWGSDLRWQPAESMWVLPGRAMKFCLVPYFLRNIWVNSLSRLLLLTCFSQSFSVECFHAFWIELLSGWRRTSSLALSSENAVLTLGCFWGRGARTISAAWLWA